MGERHVPVLERFRVRLADLEAAARVVQRRFRTAEHRVHPRALPLAARAIRRRADLQPVIRGRVRAVQELVVLGLGAVVLLHQRPGLVEEVDAEAPVVDCLHGCAHHRLLSVDQRLQSLEDDPQLGRADRRATLVVDEHTVDQRRVLALDQRRDVVERQLEPAQHADPLRAADLAARVRAVARLGVDGGRAQQPHLVVVAQCLDRQPRDAGEAADRHQFRRLQGVHPPEDRASRYGRVKRRLATAPRPPAPGSPRPLPGRRAWSCRRARGARPRRAGAAA